MNWNYIIDFTSKISFNLKLLNKCWFLKLISNLKLMIQSIINHFKLKWIDSKINFCEDFPQFQQWKREKGSNEMHKIGTTQTDAILLLSQATHQKAKTQKKAYF
jgi:hypothetical protein